MLRKTALTFAAAALAASLGAAASAQQDGPGAEDLPTEPFIMDAPLERRNFQENAPVIEIQEDGTIAPQAGRQAQAGDIIREVPEVSLNGARVAAEDTEAVARFYESAFGLWEVQRIAFGPGAPEIMLNFGDTAEEAAAKSGDIVIYPREGGPPEGDDVAHLVFNVSDVEAVVREAVHYGGEVVIPPMEFGDSGIFISYVADPEGNQIELIQGAER